MTAGDGLPPLRDVIAAHGLRARKALGQNFLLDLNLTARIARAAGPLEGHDAVEIGPGPGGLTRALLAGGARRVIAAERDSRCLAALGEIAAHWPGRLAVVHADALETDFAALARPPARIVANLPYNVGTELVARWLSGSVWPPWWRSMTVMLQREVAERIVAAPGSRAYGRLAVLAQWRAAARIAFDVGPRAFTPPPKVVSSVVHITPTEPVAEAPPAALAAVSQAAFGQRRKMLRQSLRSLSPTPAPLLEAAGIDGARRAETLSLTEFCALARAWAARAG